MKNNFESVINLLNKIINDKIKIQDEIILNETINVINTLIKNSTIYDFINSKIKINENYEVHSEVDKELLKELINYFHDNGNIYTCYDIEIFHSDKELDKKILFYFKIIELLVSYFIKYNERTILIFSKYEQYIYTLLEVFRYKVYIYLGFDEIPPFRIWNYKTQTMNEMKSIKFNKKLLEAVKFANSYNFKKISIKKKSIKILKNYYTIWWESYKSYMDKNFPKMCDKLEYYNGLNVDIYICKFRKMDEKRFGTSDLALCIGMSKNNTNNLIININEEIHQILFLNDIYKNIDDIIITLAYTPEKSNEIVKSMANSEIPSKVDDSIINYYKELLDYKNFKKFSEKLFDEIGHTILNQSNSLLIKDYITGKEIHYSIEFSQNTSKEVVEDLSKRKKKEHNLLIVNKSILNSNMKKSYLDKNIYIKDIDDMFAIFSKLKNKDKITKNLIYPYLENYVGSIQENKPNISKLLIDKLQNCPLGIEGWRQFENIILDILHYIFKDSFRQFLISPQSRNLDGTDIKDYVIGNNGIHDFWKDIKQIYNCNNIIIECKNYTKEIGINELRQVSDYLNKDTYGQFSIIFSRKGISANGKKKQSEYLMLSPKKLILVLDESDIIDLIRAKSMSQSAEETLELKKFQVETQI